jgi:hypothetical protein
MSSQTIGKDLPDCLASHIKRHLQDHFHDDVKSHCKIFCHASSLDDDHIGIGEDDDDYDDNVSSGNSNNNVKY